MTPALKSGWLRRAVFWCWIGVTAAALAGMYRLWWVREWRQYGGRSRDKATRVVLAVVGMDPSLADVANKVTLRVPPDGTYAFHGNPDHGSYLRYLLLPRLCRDGAELDIVLGGDVSVDPAATVANPEAPPPFRVAMSPGVDAPAMETADAPVKPWRGLLALILLAGALGWSLARFFGWRNITTPEKVALGLAITAGLVCVSSAATCGVGPGLAAALALILPGIARRDRDVADRRVAQEHKIEIVALVSGIVVIVACCWSFLMAVVTVPDEWDCWATWAGKAKIMLMGHGGLRDIAAYSHPEYPPLWPALWAAAAWLSGGWEDRVLKGLGPILLALCAWQVVAVAGRRGAAPGSAWWMATLFCALPAAPLIASWGYAEAALWLFSACAWGAAVRSIENPSPDTRVLAVIFAASCAMTKDDGVLVGLAIAGWMLLVHARRAWMMAFLLVSVAVTTRGVWGWWLSHGMTATGAGWSTAIVQASAWRDVLREAVAIWLDYRLWAATPLVLMAVAWNAGRRDGVASVRALLPTVGMLACFMAIIIMRSGEMAWKVGTTWNRLTLQAVIPLLFLLQPAAQRWLAGVPPRGEP